MAVVEGAKPAQVRCFSAQPAWIHDNVTAPSVMNPYLPNGSAVSVQDDQLVVMGIVASISNRIYKSGLLQRRHKI